MKSWKVLCSLVAISALLTVTAHAMTLPCQAGCGLQKKACLQSARTTKLSCNMDCRTNSSPVSLGACKRACTTTFRGSTATCRTDLQNCVSGCQGGSAGGAFTGSTGGTGSVCAGDCGQALGTCAQGVVTGAKACVNGCRTASDRLSCVEGCASAARSGAEQCASDFTSCLGQCGLPPNTTTTQPPVPSCVEAAAPVCGGSCPDSRQTCTAVGGNRCACVAG
jgi:hypothetical protein